MCDIYEDDAGCEEVQSPTKQQFKDTAVLHVCKRTGSMAQLKHLRSLRLGENTVCGMRPITETRSPQPELFMAKSLQ